MKKKSPSPNKRFPARVILSVICLCMLFTACIDDPDDTLPPDTLPPENKPPVAVATVDVR